MQTRREFIQLGLAASAIPVLVGLPSLAGSRRPNAVVFDERFPPGPELAREAQKQGLRTYGLRGEVTSLWYRDLEPSWRGGPMMVTGLTSESALFCLELLARDRGMRLVFRSDHWLGADGRWSPAASGLLSRCSDGPAAPVPVPLPDLGRNHSHLVSWVLAPRAWSCAV
jgi:hypothetical protein